MLKNTLLPLQVFAAEENAGITKMDVNNLAMVYGAKLFTL